MSEAVEFRSADGLRLEAVIDEADGPRGAVILCHPHPKMGGTMNAPLLEALCQALVAAGLTVLRFNFRGIGASEGEASDGRAEVADAAGAIDFMRRRSPRLPIAIGGWSFGAAVAIRAAAEDADLSGCVAIAPAVKANPGVTAGLPAPNEIELDVPLLVVCAPNDEVVSPEACRRWAGEVFADCAEIPGANHFFWAKYERLTETVVSWLTRVI